MQSESWRILQLRRESYKGNEEFRFFGYEHWTIYSILWEHQFLVISIMANCMVWEKVERQQIIEK